MIGQKRKMHVFVGKRRGETVHFKVERLKDGLMRLLELMRDGVVQVLGLRGR